jgi:hypothetical protein
MKPIAILCSAALLLAACSPAPQASEAPADAQAPAAQSAETSAPASAAISAEALVGRWGDNGDCTKDIVFAADGTFRSYTGGGGTWTLEGEIITITGAAGAFQVRVQNLNEQQLLVQNPDGSIGLSQRC